jgi:molybdopterin-guanine dinucleotide biosynthesis protein B
MHEVGTGAEATLAELLQRLSPCDLILIEGFKTDRHPKMEVFRAAVGKTPLHPEDDRIVAIASDQQFPGVSIPVVDINDIEAVAAMVLERAEPLAKVLRVLAHSS